MKAVLIRNGFCVHKIKKDIHGFAELHKKQYLEPISLKSIDDILEFDVDDVNEYMTHKALSGFTIGIRTLLGSSKYISYYKLDEKLVPFLRKINLERNSIHFSDSVTFTISDEFVENLEKIKDFVNYVIETKN